MPTIREIGKKCKISDSSTRKKIDQLERDGHIKKDKSTWPMKIVFINKIEAERKLYGNTVYH